MSNTSMAGPARAVIVAISMPAETGFLEDAASLQTCTQAGVNPGGSHVEQYCLISFVPHLHACEPHDICRSYAIAHDIA